MATVGMASVDETMLFVSHWKVGLLHSKRLICCIEPVPCSGCKMWFLPGFVLAFVSVCTTRILFI
jgi:hypothetical protein